MFTTMRLTALLTILALCVLAGCSDEDVQEVVFSQASFSMSGFDSLHTELYEAWVVNDGQYTSLGKFNLRFTGSLVDTLGVGISEFSSPVPITNSSRLALTIEPHPDPMTTHSAIEVLTGKVSGESVGMGFEVDYSARTGTFMLVSPSDGGGLTGVDSADGTSPFGGLWFIGKSWNSPEPGLNLESLAPDGWKYEGWYMHPTVGFISMGRFTDPVKTDESENYFDSALVDLVNLWHFPGEDFMINAPAGLTFPIDLVAPDGAMTFVTLEPEPDNSPEPFLTFNLFCKDLANTLNSNTNILLDTPELPSALVTLK